MSNQIIQSDLLVDLSPEKQQIISGGGCKGYGDEDEGYGDEDEGYNNWDKYSKPNYESCINTKPMCYKPRRFHCC
ncbi:hypothetical protein PN497_16675 [Sphaerospermopsis kisseleviana CS-549]|jgi:hypothetical protein|uniref:Uncharacterized protein n=1 Tax=Sphaerospermopsis kisseleviana CS-549 TaxID=3021783 RepID=A0ABT4ZU84_9CYAN|nr:hypothetical protein [Sphaerospermopsis kisseleviana]MDB9442983.1 hypothetical protein [Sphaerospermopsis kisseleviana CS-549]BAZ81261.1 hypothetical protein NIES73_25280 [Sphaerospermopsis kisseleviana NIES-73]